VARSSSKLIQESKLEKTVQKLKAVSHPVRLQIVNILLKGERSVGELVTMLGTHQSLTSQQLSILKLGGVLKSRRNGNKVFYSLANKGIQTIMETIIQEI